MSVNTANTPGEPSATDTAASAASTPGTSATPGTVSTPGTSATRGESGLGSRYVMPTTPASQRTTAMFNGAVAWLTRRGISVWGSRVLSVRGRASGQIRSNPVNVLTVDGRRYLVAPRGHTQWVRNLRAAGGGELRVGRRTERFTATELADTEKPAILRAYLRRWKLEVGVFFDGIGADAPDSALLAIAPGYPVFLIS
ncbi:MAG TPA: nitroreductase family deazaflavin-dependent oxidoreductase [Streptosporangiaceae bacterium]|nr:nitroreductase family deazaflavin-dependent oxidoreductase [Streptosporangiaceae bacterium]